MHETDSEKIASSGVLYVVTTPIGNMEDMTPRGVRVLSEVGLVAAEDTRTVKRLFAQLGIPLPPRIVSYFDGNEASRSEELIRVLQSGTDVALVSEAGTPSVSDPGQRLVSVVGTLDLPVVVVPGPSAVLTALVASGLPTERFTFLGFLPRDKGPRCLALGELRNRTETLVFFESPVRLAKTLRDMVEAFGAKRPAVLARELTKVHETIVRGTLGALAERFAKTPPRGECALVVGGADPNASQDLSLDLEAQVRTLLGEGLGPKDVASRLMVKTGKPRRELYQLALSLKRENT